MDFENYMIETSATKNVFWGLGNIDTMICLPSQLYNKDVVRLNKQIIDKPPVKYRRYKVFVKNTCVTVERKVNLNTRTYISRYSYKEL